MVVGYTLMQPASAILSRSIITINIFFWNIYSTRTVAAGRALANADPYFVIRKEFINPDPHE
jgi:hypothetical protein